MLGIRRTLSRRAALALLTLTLAGATVVGSLAAAHLGEFLVVSREIDDPDAIIVLASHEWERLPAAASLALRYPAAEVVLSLPGTINAQTCHRCSERPWILVEHGVSVERIRVMPDRVGSTYDEAQAALHYSAALGLKRLLVVTSPYHARRALGTFRHAFRSSSIELGVFPALAFSEARPESWWMRTYDRDYILYECQALVQYLFTSKLSAWDSFGT